MKSSFLAFVSLCLIEFASSAAITGKFLAVDKDYVCNIEKQSYHRDDKILKMYGKHLKVVGKSYGNSNVTIVDASYKGNKLQLIPNTVCHLFDQLREMKMEAVNLKILDEKSFQSCSNLNTLLLADDHIESISADAFKPCIKLQVLVFNKNPIDVLDDNAFNGLSALRSLTLRGNQISSLNSALFAPLTELTHLTIAENPIVELPDNLFSGQKSLVALDLSSNELNYLPSFLFHDKEKLESADLNGNAIASIDHRLLENVPFHLSLNLMFNECINKTFNHIGSDEIPLIAVARDLEVCFSKDPERLKVQELSKEEATKPDYSIESSEDEPSVDLKEEPVKKEDDDVFEKLGDDGTYGGIFDDKFSTKPRDQDTKESLSSSSSSSKEEEEDDSKSESSLSGDKNSTKSIETESNDAGDTSVDVKETPLSEDGVKVKNTTSESSEESSESFEFQFESREEEIKVEGSKNETRNKNSTSVIDIIDDSDSKNSSTAIDSETSTLEKESLDGANKTASINDFKAIDFEEEKTSQANETVPLDAGDKDNGKLSSTEIDSSNRTKESIQDKVSEIDHSFNTTIDSSDKNQTLSSQNKTQTPVADDVEKVLETEVKPRPVHSYEQATSRCYLNAKKEYVAVVKGAKKFLKHIITQHDDKFTNENVTVVYVTESSLQHIPKAIFETFPNVKKLSVERCGIKIMDAELLEVCGSLEFLDLSSNRIHVVAGNSLKMCPLLKFVDITGNPIEQIESSIFECNPKLNITLGSFKLVST